ncbi:MAG: YicC family protein [Verrucomicrobia bacterium]|nr:YicC family protein [Verrucomicrobiota bacterium]
MRSMTGYGRAARGFGAWQLGVELSAVNRRGAEVALALPRGWAALEARVREAVLARVARGRVQVGISCSRAAAGAEAGGLLDLALAQRFCEEARSLAAALALPGDLTLETILRCPGVIRTEGPSEAASAEEAGLVLEEVLLEALDELVQMRESEGARLAEDFRSRLAVLGALTEEIATLHPGVAVRVRAALSERLAKAQLEVPVDEDRIAKEIALFADRTDVSEELTRLRGHIEQFHTLLTRAEPVGRTLDFLTQEMARECNTLGVKCADLAISRLVVAAKAEVEKMREQVQNIE